jgi:hypothetical protein
VKTPYFIFDLQLLVLGWEDLYHVLRKYHVCGAYEFCADNNNSILEVKSVFGSQFSWIMYFFCSLINCV